MAAEPQVPGPAPPQPVRVREPRSDWEVSVPVETRAVQVQGPALAREQVRAEEAQPQARVPAPQPALPVVDPARDLRLRRPTAAR